MAITIQEAISLKEGDIILINRSTFPGHREEEGDIECEIVGVDIYFDLRTIFVNCKYVAN